MKKKGFKINIYSMLIMFGLLPMLLSVIIVSVIIVQDSKAQLKTSAFNYLFDLAKTEGEALEREAENKGMDAVLNYDFLSSMYTGVGLEDIPSSYAYVVSKDGTMMYHPTESKVGESVENEVVKGVVSDIAANKKIEPKVVDYIFKGAAKYAAYYVDKGNNFIVVISADEKDVMAGSNKIVKIACAISAVLILIFSALAFFIGNLVAGPMKSIAKMMEELSTGNVNAQFHAKSHISEINTMISSAVSLKSSLSEIAGEINGNMGNLNQNMTSVSGAVSFCNEASSDITAAVEELAKGAMEMAESVQKTAESTTEIGSGIEQITSLAGEANNNASSINQINSQAKENLNNLMQANQSTIQIVQEVAEGILDAGEAIEDISKVAQVIMDLSTQTNLLSLNASIEAARAGEAGRGFAVVASEISNLAEQTDLSAQEIHTIIDNILEKSNRNTELANKIKDTVSEEGRVLSAVSGSFQKVSECIKITTENINEITHMADALDEAKNSVIDEISTLSSISEENAASTQETDASIEELKTNIESIHHQTTNINQIAETVMGSIGFFKV